MRILQINSAKNFGGGEKHFVDLANGLRGKGHEIFVCLRKGNDWRDKLSPISDGKIFQLPLRNSLDLLSARQISKILCDNKIEILHAHTARDYPLAAFAVRQHPATKLVLTRHVLFKMKLLNRFALANVAKVIAVSAAVENRLKTQRIFPHEKIIAIPNGIEIERWASVEKAKLRAEFREFHNVAENEFLIGIVGELKDLKGQEEFILASQEIIKSFPSTKFVVVGKDNSFDQSFRLKLRRLIKVFGLTDKFIWLDWINETANVLNALDVFVSASRIESFGLAIVEAMASSCAIVATETDGAKEILDGGNYGKLVPIKDAFAISEAVKSFLTDANLRQTFGEKAQNYAIEKFSLARMIDETERIYREITIDIFPK